MTNEINRNQAVQAVLADALAVATAWTPENDVAELKKQMTVAYLTYATIFTKSGNSIPAMGGLGLEEAVKTSQDIIAGINTVSTRMNFKHMGLALV